MLIVMKAQATDVEVTGVVNSLQERGLEAHLSRGKERVVIGAVGDVHSVTRSSILALEGVERIIPIAHPFKLVSRNFKNHDTVVDLGVVQVGDRAITVFAGPCAVEGRDVVLSTAAAVARAGATGLRGGAFKPRTSPYSFQGLGSAGLEILAEARALTGLPVVTEAMTPQQVAEVAEMADVIQLGARNMQNYDLLQEAGRARKPVLLKRGMSSTVDEWLLAAEYIVAAGNPNVILCERGIRTFSQRTRNTLDLSAIPLVKELSHLPVIVDPSHATGHWSLVGPMARAAIAAGADGLLVEVHADPATALCDGGQSLTPENFGRLMEDIELIARAQGRQVARLRQRQPQSTDGLTAASGTSPVPQD